MTYIDYGRCQSGRRWFWFAGEATYDDAQACGCGDPVCQSWWKRHGYGWEDTEQAAIEAMSEAVISFGGEVHTPVTKAGKVCAPGSAGAAAHTLKRINVAKRRARPPSAEQAARVVEYLWAEIEHYSEDSGYSFSVSGIPIVRKTAKRIYFEDTRSYDRYEGVITLRYISRQELETDTRCPGPEYPVERRCEHGNLNSHGYPPGEIYVSGYRGMHMFTTREAAEVYVNRDREEQVDVKELRRKMAAAHPDRGGDPGEFMALREQYERAKAMT